MNADPSPSLPTDPLAQSLVGEHMRMLLVGTAACSCIASAVQIGGDPTSMLLVMGNLLVLLSLMSTQSGGLIRAIVLIGFAIALTMMTSQSTETNRWFLPFVFFSPAMLLASLLLLAFRDFWIALQNTASRPSYRILGAGVGFGIVVIYMVIVPSIDAYLEQFRERPTSYTIEAPTVFEELRIRTAKFAVFAIFTYCGACIASFINVVAASAPRGESVAFRTSACPKCNAPIGRIDNLPIFSYLNLGGRCRNCSVRIPIRYFVAECIGATIFGSLFLFELVTGAANVPGFQHYHAVGILWIILYTKWPVVGIYFYHAALMSCLLMLSLIDIDRLRCPKWLAWGTLIVFAALPIAIPTLQPVAWDAQIPVNLSGTMPSWLTSAVNGAIGGLVGWMIATLFRQCTELAMYRRFWGRSLWLAMALIGIAIGWQATITIAALCAVAITLLIIVGQNIGVRLRVPATGLLLAIAMIHHPAWKWLAGFW